MRLARAAFRVIAVVFLWQIGWLPSSVGRPVGPERCRARTGNRPAAFGVLRTESSQCFPWGPIASRLMSSKRRSKRSSRALSLANTIKERTHGGTRRSDRFRSGRRRGVGLMSQPISASIGPMPVHGNLGWTTSPKSCLAVRGEMSGTAPIALPESICSRTSLPS